MAESLIMELIITMKNLNQNKMKSKEERKGFTYGMGTMLMASIGTNLFGQGGWVTYVGLALIIVSSIIVYTYIKSE
jgi:hypothetical protein